MSGAAGVVAGTSGEGRAWLEHPGAYAAGAPAVAVLGAGTTLAAPGLLGPVAFGEFALLSSLFQVTFKGDLGLSQLADRDLCRPDPSPGRAGRILRARLRLALVAAAILGPILCGAAWWSEAMPPLDVALALLAGCAAMVANGPVTVLRATGQVGAFTAAALALHAGLTAPRLFGILAWGVTGCFAALAAWYVAMAIRLYRTAPRDPGGDSSTLPLLRESLPLFAFSGLWMFYLLCNRWIAAELSHPVEFGLFAFGANLAFTAVSLLGTVAQVRYPSLLAGLAADGPGSRAGRIERDAALLGFALAVAGAVAAPLAPSLTAWLFPDYVEGVGAALVMAVSCVALGVSAWFMPVVVALARRPVIDAVLTIGPGLAVMTAGMALGERWGGIAGQAWGCVAGSLALLAGVAATLARLGLLPRGRALRLALVTATQVALAGVAVANPLAPPPQAPVPGADWNVAFEDRFERLDLWQGGKGTWQPTYPSGGRWNVDNRELQYYVDPRPGRDPEILRALDPFRIGDGLAIVARPLPPQARSAASGQTYVSGMLTTAKSFRFTYGYVEVEARIPKGKGIWPAVWLLPAAGGWPPEIDVVEVLGDDTAGYWATLHTGTAARRREVQSRVAASDLSRDFHAYGLLWGPKEIAWYLDGKRVFSTPTPADMHVPMYLLLNLAVGGRWPGSPDAGTPFPAEFRIRRARVLVPSVRQPVLQEASPR